MLITKKVWILTDDRGGIVACENTRSRTMEVAETTTKRIIAYTSEKRALANSTRRKGFFTGDEVTAYVEKYYGIVPGEVFVPTGKDDDFLPDKIIENRKNVWWVDIYHLISPRLVTMTFTDEKENV